MGIPVLGEKTQVEKHLEEISHYIVQVSKIQATSVYELGQNRRDIEDIVNGLGSLTDAITRAHALFSKDYQAFREFQNGQNALFDQHGTAIKKLLDIVKLQSEQIAYLIEQSKPIPQVVVDEYKPTKIKS